MTLPLLSVENLYASTAGKEILRGINLVINAGEIHALIGANGSGKSTLANALTGRPACEITGGKVLWRGRDLLAMLPEERARAGLFLAFQHPVEIPGARAMSFLRVALEARCKEQEREPPAPAAFLQRVRAIAKDIGMDESMLRREVHTGFSGGEKKRFEMLQMEMLEPDLIILDEIDSGLDARGVKTAARLLARRAASGSALLVISHYPRLLEALRPSYVHILDEGKIIRSGGAELIPAMEQQAKAG